MIIKKIVQHTAMLTLAAAVSISASSVHADSVNYIIPFGPGGESDVSARMQLVVNHTMLKSLGELLTPIKKGGLVLPNCF